MGCKTDKLPNLYAMIIIKAPIPYKAKPPIKYPIFPSVANFQKSCPIQTEKEDIIIRYIPFLFLLNDSGIIYSVIIHTIACVSLLILLS